MNSKLLSLGLFAGILSTSSLAAVEVIVDVGGFESVGGRGNPLNPTFLFDIGTAIGAPGEDISIFGAGWDTVVTSFDPSFGSELLVGFDWNNDGLLDITINPSITAAPVIMEVASSDGVFLLSDFGVADGFSPGGIVRVEILEDFDDPEVDVDGRFEPGSTFTLDAAVVPEPSSIFFLALGGSVFLRRRR